MIDSSETLNEAIELTSAIYDELETLIGDIQGIEKRMKVLERQGMCQASIWMRDNKYMYLVHPTDKDGNRKREYVGRDFKAQVEAKSKIERQTLWDDYQKEREEKKRKVDACLRSLHLQLRNLKSEQLPLWQEGA